MGRSIRFVAIFNFFFTIFYTASAPAHVKWFTRLRMERPPQTFTELNDFNFWILAGLSVVTIAFLVFLDQKLGNWKTYNKFDEFLAGFSKNAVLILRVFTGAALLLSWQADSMIAPELRISSSFVGWYQYAIALFLLTRKTTPLSGLMMMLLYPYAMTQYGFFHLLDYMVYFAIGYFLFVSNFKNKFLHSSRVPALYLGLGFSLCWAALEKIFFPYWGMDVLAQQPGLTMGLPHDFFLLSCAFVELSLGYLLIIGLLQRPLALTITLVFFTTTAFFGKPELIGHTILHGALLVFIVIGPGNYFPRPIDWHKRLWLKASFAGINFLLVTGVLGLLYHQMSWKIFRTRQGAPGLLPPTIHQQLPEEGHDHQ